VLLASVIVALTIIPPMAHLLLARKARSKRLKQVSYVALIVLGVVATVWLAWWAGTILVALGVFQLLEPRLPERLRGFGPKVATVAAILLVGVLLTNSWLPLGPELGFCGTSCSWGCSSVGCFSSFRYFSGGCIRRLEFMPRLDEGSFLFMPTTMPHASIGEALDVLQLQDMGFSAIPEVESAVGKIGRAESPLDPAPVSMIETVINYKPEYITDEAGIG
jgi:copper/silver efflux system protein